MKSKSDYPRYSSPGCEATCELLMLLLFLLRPENAFEATPPTVAGENETIT